MTNHADYNVLTLGALFDDAAVSRHRELGPWQLVVERHGPLQVTFVRGACPLHLRLAAVTSAELVPAGGWLLEAENGWAYWVPREPAFRSVDEHCRMQRESSAPVEALVLRGGEAQLNCPAPKPGEWLDIAIWRLPAEMAQELRAPVALERQAAYLWGSHTPFARYADIGIHLIHGRVYENRWAWPFKRRICSENDAHAIAVHLGGLHRATGHRLPALMARIVVDAVMARVGPDGAFRHGVWTKGMESHYRLHCSAMHLMMDSLAETPDDSIRRCLAASAAFLAGTSLPAAGGLWFLHDDLERSEEQMRGGPFRWVDSQALGKTRSNMMVLNSHIDAIVALDRYRETTGDDRYVATVEQARVALRTVLAQRPAEMLYRVLFRLIGLTFLPTPRAAALPVWWRALKRITWQRLIPKLPDVKARWPRFVMPSGYIDRELTLRTWAHDYHAINLMDLARYLRRFPDEALVREVLVAGMDFTRNSGILDRWREMDYQKYALGFWLEALYHACTLFPDPRYRVWLADAILTLEDLRMGLSPSLLGANAEAVAVDQQVPCPVPTDERLRVANIGNRQTPEFLVLNPGSDAVALEWASPAPAGLVWQHPDGSPCASDLLLSPRSWVWARAFR
ncbi:MAG: hypothetical protein QM702_19690 [Rubrivivax sp.]